MIDHAALHLQGQSRLVLLRAGLIAGFLLSYRLQLLRRFGAPGWLNTGLVFGLGGVFSRLRLISGDLLVRGIGLSLFGF